MRCDKSAYETWYVRIEIWQVCIWDLASLYMTCDMTWQIISHVLYWLCGIQLTFCGFWQTSRFQNWLCGFRLTLWFLTDFVVSDWLCGFRLTLWFQTDFVVSDWLCGFRLTLWLTRVWWVWSWTACHTSRTLAQRHSLPCASFEDWEGTCRRLPGRTSPGRWVISHLNVLFLWQLHIILIFPWQLSGSRWFVNWSINDICSQHLELWGRKEWSKHNISTTASWAFSQVWNVLLQNTVIRLTRVCSNPWQHTAVIISYRWF